MKFTTVLYQIHLGRAARRLWQMKREIPVTITKSESVLASMGYEVVNAKAMVQDIIRKENMIKLEYPVFDPREDNAKEKEEVPLYLYETIYALQAGLDQAKLLTNTVIKEEDLSDQYEVEDIPDNIDQHVQRIITNSTIFDAHQELLPKIKNPEKPMHVFPRLYGLSQHRKTHNIVTKLLQFCECLSGPDIMKERYVEFKDDIIFRLERFENTMQCNITVDALLRSSKPLEPIAPVGMKSDYQMPNIYPLDPFISMPNVEKAEEFKKTTWTDTRWQNMHTVFLYHNPEMIKNLTELPVTDDQILARTLMHVFTVAANCAVHTHKSQIDRLAKPITVQCVQTDGQEFVFSVFQLNGMHDDLVNYWWVGPSLRLYRKAEYEDGRPVFTEYNENVFKSLLGFYRRQ